MTAAPLPETNKERHATDMDSSSGGGDQHRDDEPRCDFCGRACGHYTRFDGLSTPVRRPPRRR
jgi:hypothetical protein